MIPFNLHIIPSVGNLRPNWKEALCIIQWDDIAVVWRPGVVNDLRSQHDTIYGYLHDNETFDGKLMQAIPIYLRYPDVWDVLVLWKKVTMPNGEDKYYTVPRIFKPEILIGGTDSLLIPENKDVRYVNCLDGWILEDGRRLN